MEIEILIHEVEQREVLYDKQNKHYKNRDIVKKAWNDVGVALHCITAMCNFFSHVFGVGLAMFVTCLMLHSSSYTETASIVKENETNLKNELGITNEENNSIDELLKAQEQWDSVQCIEPLLGVDANGIPREEPLHPLQSSTVGFPPGLRITPLIDFDEAWEYFTRQDMSHVMPFIKPVVEKKGFNGFLRAIFGPRKLKQELISERNLLFAIAQCSLDNNEPIHLQILMTIYKALTGTKYDCPRYGNHWDHIGFQGVDPATDLRGVGLLGLVQALHLVSNEETLPLVRDMHILSHDPYSQFPLMVLSINVTRISIQALREEVLNRECNSRGNVRHVLNEFFAAVMFHIFWIWKTEKKTITDSGFLIKDAEAYCKANVRTVLHKLRVRLRRYSLVENSYQS